jgi:Mg-chelatase subunit ChlD
VTEAGRRTASRRDLSRAPVFEQVSPQVGELDETAFEEALADDADAALGLLADLAGATDQRLRALARRLAGRVAVRLVRTGPARRRGVGRLRRVRLEPGGDLDVEGSLDALLAAAASGRPPAVEDLRGTAWARPATALCLVVDRSGSVGGERLATASLAAAAVALRAPDDYSVVAFSDKALVVKSQDRPRPVADVVDDLLQLRGHGLTDIAVGLDAARAQLERSPATRRVTVLLSDGRPTAGPDPISYARRLDELVVVAPADDAAEARALAAAAGARFSEVAGPSDVPRALQFLSDG